MTILTSTISNIATHLPSLLLFAIKRQAHVGGKQQILIIVLQKIEEVGSKFFRVVYSSRRQWHFC